MGLHNGGKGRESLKYTFMDEESVSQKYLKIVNVFNR